MKKFFAGFFVSLLCLCLQANELEKNEVPETPEATVPQYAEMLQTDDELFKLVHLLSLQATGVCLADREPATRGEVLQVLENLDKGLLDAKGVELYELALAYLHKKDYLLKSKNFAFETNCEFALQAQYSESDKLLQADNIAHYNKTPALIAVPISINISPFVNLATVLELKKGFWASQYSIPFTNMPLKNDAIDVQFPHTANISAGNSFMSFILGRGRHRVGQTLNGSLFLADATHSLDFASLRFFHKNFSIAASVAAMERYRFLFTHEINFKITKYVGVRLFEGTTLYGSFDFRYLNPFMIFHNLYGWDERDVNGFGPNGSHFGIGLEVVPYKGMRFYGQFEMNQFQTSYERKEYPGASSVTPNSLGGLVGFEYTHLFPVGALTAQAEFLYANPWLNILEHRDISFVDKHVEKVAPVGWRSKSFYIWLTNPLGPDTIAFTTKLSFEEFFKYGLSLKYRLLVKGENEKAFFDEIGKSNETTRAYYPTDSGKAKIKTPSGNPLYVHTLSLEGFHEVYKNLRLTAQFDISFFTGRETKKTALYASAGINYKIR